MGGLLGRLYVTGFGGVQYKRNENFMEGDFHKLITLNTPHKGSPLANLLTSTNPALLPLKFAADELLGCTSCGAVADLRTDSTVNTSWLAQNVAEVPCHAIVSTGGSDIINLLTDLQDLALPARRLMTFFVGYDVEEYMQDALGEHDGIVGRASQEGNIPNHTTVFGLPPTTTPPISIRRRFRFCQETRSALQSRIC